MRTTEEPKVTHDDSPIGGTIFNHPAYGQISASRVSGSANLYDSDFRHNAFVTIRISHSEMRRDLSRDWHHATNGIIEVALSEAQWATFVSSLNHGSGPCCTIEHLKGQTIPGLPDPPSRVNQFSKEIEAAAEKCIAKVNEAVAELEEMKIPKGKTGKIRAAFESVLRALKDSMPFVAKQFDRHAETTVEKAKQEIHGYMQSVVQRAGLAALQGELPLNIEHKETPIDLLHKSEMG